MATCYVMMIKYTGVNVTHDVQDKWQVLVSYTGGKTA